MDIQRVMTTSWFLYLCLTTRKIFLGADTTTIRLLLAWSSLVSSVSLLADSDKFAGPAYTVVARFGNEYTWAAYFALHFIGVHWRLYDPVARPRAALAINTFGFAVWFISTASICWAVGAVGIATAMSLTLCVASAWALYRTGLQREIVTT